MPRRLSARRRSATPFSTCAPIALALLSLVLSATPVFATEPASRVVETRLEIARGEIVLDGEPESVMTVNGSVPGPTLRWRVGDLARIHVTNRMDVPTSVHWHGLLLPNRQDGVPGLTTPGIRPGGSHVFEIPIRHAGTYWYHSHTALQEQRGVYGAIVIDPATPPMHSMTDRDVVVVLSDFTRRDPNAVMRLLKRGSEWMSIEKGTAQSLWGALRMGELGAVFRRSLGRMPPMDISDVAYDAFLMNGEREISIAGRPGERLRLRVVNAAASTYFYLGLGGAPLEVIAADGVDVETEAIDRLLVAIAETYDVRVTVPPSGRVELRATAQDGSGSTSAWIGDPTGTPIPASDVPRPNLYAMRHAGHGSPTNPTHSMSHDHGNHMRPPTSPDEPGAMKHDMADTESSAMKHDMAGSESSAMDDALAGTQAGAMPQVMEHDAGPRPPAPYARLRATRDSRMPEAAPRRTIRLRLTGNMDRYVWSFDGRTLDEADEIRVERGEVLRVELENTTMMHHPLHLHGHFFRVLGADGARADDPTAPWKHTVDVAPMQTTTIEFLADAEGDWFFHCHVLYHMKAGMSRIFHYAEFEADPALAEARERLFSDPVYAWAEGAAMSHFSEGLASINTRRNELIGEWEIGWQNTDDDVDAEVTIRLRRHPSRLYRVFAGAHFEPGREVGIVGGEANLPLGFMSGAWVDTEGHVRVMLDQELALTTRLSAVLEGEYDTQREWEGSAGLRWRVGQFGSIAFEWHSEFGPGGGVELIY